MQALIIDDSRGIRAVLARMLSELGIASSEAEDGRDALDKLRDSSAPDFILVDWNMPKMNGLEFVRAMRAETRWNAVPLMMVTTESEIGQMVQALEAGANEYLMKPFTKEALADKLSLLGMVSA
jgi:two-component system chemotaxis response regulator CheY